MAAAIEINGLSYSYESGLAALRDINLAIQTGEMVALVGQNGAGKTTLVKHLIGLIKPPAGKVTVLGQDVAGCKVSVMAKKLGFIFQNPDHQIFHDTVEKEVAFGLQNMGLPRDVINQRVSQALQAVNLENQAQAYPHTLSRGQRQRVALASVLAMETDIIVLDEPTTGQDYRERVQIMDLVTQLNEAGHTIIFITHDMSLVANYAKRVIVLCQGRLILDGTVREVMKQQQKLAQTLLEPPQITLLANRLVEMGILTPGSEVTLTVEEMYSNLKKVLEV